jgi:energy-converting hydrogenase B subunit D
VEYAESRDNVTVLQIVILVLVAAGGTGVILTRDPLSQAVGVSFFGLLLAILFLVFQAPDVALSAIVVGAMALPLMILLALAKTRGRAG